MKNLLITILFISSLFSGDFKPLVHDPSWNYLFDAYTYKSSSGAGIKNENLATPDFEVSTEILNTFLYALPEGVKSDISNPDYFPTDEPEILIEKDAISKLKHRCKNKMAVLNKPDIYENLDKKYQSEHRPLMEDMRTYIKMHYELKEEMTSQEVQDPESRFYTRAVKLVELGATLEEIMRECELPRAEAELLVNFHRK